MKELFLLFCALVAHVNSQCGCGCSPPPLPCRTPPLARPLPCCPKPVCPPPPCPPPLSCCPRPLPPCPPPIPACPRPVPYPRPCECSAPIVEYIDFNVSPVIQSPVVTYEVVTPYASALPTCNCPSPPTLPVSTQILPSIGSPVCPSFLNAGLGLGISPCLGGISELAAVSPIGLINPFLPAASPISALAPTVSSLYPPINPCNCGCKYLRKIPIPPPCL